jgi:hypothetical protein
VGPRVSLDDVDKILYPTGTQNSYLLVDHVDSCYTNCTSPALPCYYVSSYKKRIEFHQRKQDRISSDKMYGLSIGLIGTLRN